MADAGGLQLLPQNKRRVDLHMPGDNKSLVLAVLFLVLVLATYGGIYLYNSSLRTQITAADSQLAEVERSRDRAAETRLLGLAQQMAVVQPILSSHVVWSNALLRIQSLIQPRVQIESLSANVGKKVFQLRGNADSFVTVARQVAAFYTEPLITDISLGRVQSSTNGKVDFDIQITLDPQKVTSGGAPNSTP